MKVQNLECFGFQRTLSKQNRGIVILKANVVVYTHNKTPYTHSIKFESSYHKKGLFSYNITLYRGLNSWIFKFRGIFKSNLFMGFCISTIVVKNNTLLHFICGFLNSQFFMTANIAKKNKHSANISPCTVMDMIY